jgi:hypothetical protein
MGFGPLNSGRIRWAEKIVWAFPAQTEQEGLNQGFTDLTRRVLSSPPDVRSRGAGRARQTSPARATFRRRGARRRRPSTRAIRTVLPGASPDTGPQICGGAVAAAARSTTGKRTSPVRHRWRGQVVAVEERAVAGLQGRRRSPGWQDLAEPNHRKANRAAEHPSPAAGHPDPRRGTSRTDPSEPDVPVGKRSRLSTG